MNKQYRRLLALAACLALLCLTGCDRRTEQSSRLPVGAAENEILTLTPVAQDKELVTIHYEYGLDITSEIEKAVEERFPNVDVVMVHDGASDSIALMERNLRHGTECDLIFSRSIYTRSDLAETYLLDLSGEAFINNFYLTSLSTCVSPDGGLYYLPGPANMYGVIYDKTVLEENGWAVPDSYSGFVELIRTIDNADLTVMENIDGEVSEVPVRAIRPSIKFSDAFRSLFYPFAYRELFAGQENLEWLTAYQRGEGSMVGHMEPFIDILRRLFEDGVVRPEDWDYLPRYRLPMLCDTHSTVMILGPLNTFANEQLVNSDHEFAILPMFTGDDPDSDYLYSIPTYFMGISRASAEVSSERRQLLLDIMGFICAPDAQEKLFGEANTLVSNIKGVNPGENSFNAAIKETIEEGRIITDFYTLAETALNSGARDVVSGAITGEEYLLAGDAARDQWLSGTLFAEPQVLGTCEETLTRFETALLVGQIYRDVTGADIALVYVNTGDQGVNCRLFEGTVDTTDLNNIAPDRTSAAGEGIASGSLTGRQILECLNGASAQVGNSSQWYYVASGLNVEFAPWMPTGERLVSCTLPDGSPLEPDALYRVAYMSDKIFTVEGDSIIALAPGDEQIVEGGWSELFPKWIGEHGGVIRRPEQTTVLNWMTKE